MSEVIYPHMGIEHEEPVADEMSTAYLVWSQLLETLTEETPTADLPEEKSSMFVDPVIE